MNPVLIKLTPLGPNNQRVNVYVGDTASPTAAGAGGFAWEPAIGERPTLSLELMSPDLSGKVQAGTAKFTLLLRQIRNVDRPFELYWPGAMVTIQSTGVIEGDGAIPDFVGMVTDGVPDLDTGQVEITASVQTTLIDKNLLFTSFDGGGGLRGDAGFRGTAMPAGFGTVLNIQPVMFDATHNIGMIDGYGNTLAITWAGEGLATFGPAVANYPDYDTLRTAIINGAVKPGQWATSVQPNQPGLIGLGAPSVGIVTCHARFGYGTMGALMRRILETHCQLDDGHIDVAAFAALDQAVPQPVHYWTSDQRSTKDLLEALAQSCNATPLLTFRNVVTVTRATRSAAVGTLNRNGGASPRVLDWQAAAVDPPYWKLAARVARPASVLTLDQVNYGVKLNDRGTYDPDTVYSDGDIVWDTNGASYLYYYSQPAAGVPLTDNTHWDTQVSAPVIDWRTQIEGAGKPQDGATRNFFHGDYDANTVYTVGDQVSDQSAIWNYIGPSDQGHAPPQLPTEQNTWWQLYVSADSQAALDAIAALSSDSLLTGIEKKALIVQVDQIHQEAAELVQRAAGQGVDTSAFQGALNALNTYLAGLQPSWQDVTQNTPIDPTTFRNKFSSYYSQREEVELEVGQNIDADIASIVSDNIIKAGSEKGELIRDQQAASAQQQALVAISNALNQQFGSDVTKSQRDAMNLNWLALVNYLQSLQPAWNDITQDTPVNGPQLRNLFAQFETSANTLDQANQTYTSSTAAATLQQVALISSDGWLSKSEKPAVIQDWAGIAAEHPTLDAQADRLRVDRTAYDASYTALANYLGGLRPQWDDTSQDTPIVAADFRNAFTNYETAKTTLLAAMTQAAAQSVPVVNRLRYSRFEAGTRGWSAAFANPSNIITTPLYTGDNQGKTYLGTKGTATGQAGQGFSVQCDTEFSVTPGEWLCVAVGLQGLGPVASRQINVIWRDASGSDSAIPTFSAADNGQAPYDFRMFKFMQVPSGAVKAHIQLFLFSTSSSGVMDCAITDPMVCAVSQATAAAGVAPAFVAGPNADNAADVTSQNTAADTAAVAGVPAAQLTQTASAANSLATAAKQFADDAADNDHMSGDEKKRWRGQIQAWAGTQDGSVNAIIAKLNSYGLSANATAVQNAWSNSNQTGFYDYLVRMNYTSNSSTKFSAVGLSRDGFKSIEGTFSDALEAASKALTAQAATQTSQSAGNQITDPTFARLGNKAEWDIVTFNNGSSAQDDSQGRRLDLVGGSYANLIQTVKKPCSTGDIFDLNFDAYIDNNYGGDNTDFYADFFDNNGNYLNNRQFYMVFNAVQVLNARNQWVPGLNGRVTAPAGAAFVAHGINSRHSAGNLWVRNPVIWKTPLSLTNISSAGRQQAALMTTAYAVNGSVQVSGLTESTDSSSITIGNFSVDFGDGYQSITGTTITGLSAGTLYYVWLLAPVMNNVFRSFSVSTSFAGNTDKQRVYLGPVYTKNSDGSQPGGGGTTPGKPTLCVAEHMRLADGTLAADYDEGPIMLLRRDWKGTEIVHGKSLGREFADCVRLMSERGAVLECSTETPFDLPDGEQALAPMMAGRLVATLVENHFAIERVVAVRPIGRRPVNRISAGGRCYFAGREARALIASHNVAKP
jgi:hypothetical protein